MAETRLLLPLQIGHESEMLDTLTPSGQSQFRWTVFVRSAESLQFTDRSFISKFFRFLCTCSNRVEKELCAEEKLEANIFMLGLSFLMLVVFELHPDFGNPKRTVKEPPFEVTETGYAGFTIPIQISFMGVSKTYKLIYDMNLVLEKQSKHCVEQLLLIKQPSNEFYELALKYGARIKKEKKKKEKHSERNYDYESDQSQRYETAAAAEAIEKETSKKKKNLQTDCKSGTLAGSSASSENKVFSTPTTSTAAAASKNFLPKKVQKASEENEKGEKTRTSRVLSPADRSHGVATGRGSSPAVNNSRSKKPPPNTVRDSGGPAKERGKVNNDANNTAVASSSVPVPPNDKNDKLARKSNPTVGRFKSGQREKSVERQKCAVPVNGEKLKSSPSESMKSYADDQSPPSKKRKQELSVDTLLAVQKNLMDIENSERMFAVVDAIFSSSEWPVPSLEYSEDTKILSFDLFALDPALILKLEELCQR
uniref:AHD domain-containing protein n=1 Tax=Syphacia muris TaxID=451379 RepID=A0A0N5B0K0_9BILA